MSTAKKGTTASTVSAVLDAYNLVIAEAKAEFDAWKSEQLQTWNTELARKKEQDLYDFSKEKRDREDSLNLSLKSRLATVEEREAKAKERELALGDAEKMIATLNAELAKIPVLEENCRQAGYSQGRLDTTKDYEAEIKITEARHVAATTVLENKIESLEATVETLYETIATLREELKASNERVSTIATNAVNASGQSKVTVNAAPTK